MAYIGQLKAKEEMEQILDLGLAFPERKTIAKTVLLYGSSGDNSILLDIFQCLIYRCRKNRNDQKLKWQVWNDVL